MEKEGLKEAQVLCSPKKDSEEYNTFLMRQDKGFSIFKKLCMSAQNSIEQRFQALEILSSLNTEETDDILCRLRDAIGFLKKGICSDVVKLLKMVSCSPSFSSFQRLMTAASLYNYGFLDTCYECFIALACDDVLMVNHREEAIRFLFASQREDFKKIAFQNLVNIVNSHMYPSKYRYGVLARFITNRGIKFSKKSVFNFNIIIDSFFTNIIIQFKNKK